MINRLLVVLYFIFVKNLLFNLLFLLQSVSHHRFAGLPRGLLPSGWLIGWSLMVFLAQTGYIMPWKVEVH